MLEQPSYYAIIPANVRYADITPNAKLLYGEITALSNKNGYCYAGNEYFSSLYKVRARTITSWIKELIDNISSQTVEIFKDCGVPDSENTEIITLTPGTYEIAGETVTVKECGMLPLHFVSRKTGHNYVSEFKPYDFRYWYDKKAGMITPIITSTFKAEGFTPILTSGNMDDKGSWHKVLACGEKIYNGKKYIICQVDLRCENPVAKRFLRNINK